MSWITGYVKSILVDPNIDGTAFPVLTMTFGGGRNVVYEITDSIDLDLQSQEIQWAYETGFTSNEDGSLYTFTAVQLRAALSTPEGATILGITLEICPMDETAQTVIRNLPLVSRPKKWYSAVVDMVAEQVRLKISGANQVYISKLALSAAKKAETRPRD